MYHIGDVVVYGTEGVCEVREIADVRFGHETNEYYILSPINKETDTFYIPTKAEQVLQKLRPILSSEEAKELIASKKGNEIEWIEEDRKRAETFKKILIYGSASDILDMIRVLYEKKIELEKIGKRIHSMDDKLLRDGEKLLFSELAYALKIDVQDVFPLIVEK